MRYIKPTYLIPVSENFAGLSLRISDIIDAYQKKCKVGDIAKINDFNHYICDIEDENNCDNFVEPLNQKYPFMCVILIGKYDKSYFVDIRLNSTKQIDFEKLFDRKIEKITVKISNDFNE